MQKTIHLIQQDPRTGFAKLFIDLQTQLVEPCQLLQNDQVYQLLKLYIDNVKYRRFALQPLLFLSNAELPQDLQRLLFPLLSEGVPEVFSIIVQNVVSKPVLAQFIQLLLKQDFNATILTFCSFFDPENNNKLLQQHCKNLLMNQNLQNNIFERFVFKTAMKCLGKEYESIQDAVRRIQIKDYSKISYQQFVYLISCLECQFDLRSLVDYVYELSDLNLIRNLLFTIPNSLNLILEKQPNKQFKLSKNNVINNYEVQKLDQNTFYQNLINQFPELYFLQFTEYISDLADGVPQFQGLIPPNRRNYVNYQVFNCFSLQKLEQQDQVRVQCGLAPLAFLQCKDQQSCDRMLLKFGDDNLLLFLAGLLNENIKNLILEKLRINERFQDFFAVFSDFPALPSLNDIQDFSVELPIILNYEFQQDSLNITEIISCQSDQDFLNSQSFAYLYNLMEKIDQQDQQSMITVKNVNQLIIEQLNTQSNLNGFSISFCDSVPEYCTYFLLQFLLRTDQEYLFVKSIGSQSAILHKLFFHRVEAIRGMAVTLLIRDISMISDLESYIKFNVLDVKQQEFVRIQLAKEQDQGAKNQLYEEFKIYKVESTDEQLAGILPLMHAIGDDQFIQELMFYDNDIAKSQISRRIESKFMKIVLNQEGPKSVEDILTYQLVQRYYMLSINPSTKDNNEIMLENLQRQYKAPMQLSVQLFKDLQLFGSLLRHSDSIQLTVKTGLMTMLHAFTNNQIVTPTQIAALQLFVESLIRFSVLLKNQGQFTESLANALGAFTNQLIKQKLIYELKDGIQLLLLFQKQLPESLSAENVVEFCNQQRCQSQEMTVIIYLFKSMIANNQWTMELQLSFEKIISFLHSVGNQYLIPCKLAYADFFIALSSKFKQISAVLSVDNEVMKKMAEMQKQLLQEFAIGFLQLEISQRSKQDIQKVESKIKVSNNYFQQLFGIVMSQDRLYILENKFIGQRQYFKFRSLSWCLAKSLYYDYNQGLLQLFLKLSQCGAAFLQQYYLDTPDEESDLITNYGIQVTLENLKGDFESLQVFWMLLSHFLVQVEDQMLFMDILKALLQIQSKDAIYLDLLVKICFKLLISGDKYQFHQIGNLAQKQEELISLYFQTGEQQKYLILYFISMTLTKQNLTDSIINKSIQLQKELDYQETDTDDFRLSFLCHVRNLLGNEDRRRSEVLPAQLLRCVRVMRKRGTGVE